MDIVFFTPSYLGLVKIYEVSLQRQGGAISMIFSSISYTIKTVDKRAV